MPTTIEVNKQSVETLLGSGKTKPFVIPEYQRPYAWTSEQVETLFEDLWEFTTTSGGTERDGSFSCKYIDGENEYICDSVLSDIVGIWETYRYDEGRNWNK